MKKKTTIIVSLVILLSAILFYVQDYMLEQITPEQVIEERGYCDVIYFGFEDGHEIKHSSFLGNTPTIGIGVIWDRDDTPVISLRSNDPRLAGWIGDVIRAALTVGEPWRAIEIDVLYEIDGELQLGGSVVIFRKDGFSGWRLDDLEGDLALEGYNKMVRAGQIQMISVWMYPRKYNRGVNCEVKEEWKKYFSTKN